MRPRRMMIAVAMIVMVVAACGGRPSPMSAYIERLNDLVIEFTPRGEAIWLSYLDLPDPTMDDLVAMMEAEAVLRADVASAVGDLEAPTRIADEHEQFARWTAELVVAEEALARRAATSPTWEAFAGSAEFDAVEALYREGSGLCLDFKESLDTTDTKQLFEGTPWVPTDLSDAVDALLGCETIPDDLEVAFGH